MPAHLIGRHRQAPVVSECLLCADGSRPSSVYERLLWGKQTLRILLSVAANNLK